MRNAHFPPRSTPFRRVWQGSETKMQKGVDRLKSRPYMALTDAALTVSTGSDATVANSDGQPEPGVNRVASLSASFR
jgi:hypothetical protein